MEDPSDGDTDIRTGYRGCSDHTFETMELSGGDCTVPCIWPVCMEPDESRKETGKDGTGDHFGRDHAGRRKGSDREVTVGKGPYYRRTERKTIQYDNLGEQLAELDEINEQSREYEMKRQAVQMAAEHLEQLSGAMRGYLKRDLNEKASAIIREITGENIQSSSQMKNFTYRL